MPPKIAAILTSLLMVSMAATEDLIQSMMNQAKEQNKNLKFYSELSFKERGKKIGQILNFLPSFHSFSFFSSAQCLPFFIFLTIFRVTSFSLVLVVLRVYSIIIYIVLLSILFLGLLMSTSSSSATKYVRETRKKKGLIYFVVLPFRTMFTYYMFTTGCPKNTFHGI